MSVCKNFPKFLPSSTGSDAQLRERERERERRERGKERKWCNDAIQRMNNREALEEGGLLLS